MTCQTQTGQPWPEESPVTLEPSAVVSGFYTSLTQVLKVWLYLSLPQTYLWHTDVYTNCNRRKMQTLLAVTCPKNGHLQKLPKVTGQYMIFTDQCYIAW